MKEYPEEFLNDYLRGRWGNIVDDARSYLPKEDVEALDEGYRQMQIDRFNERVLARLASEDKQEAEETMTIKASGRYTTGFTDPRVPYEQAMKQAQYDADMQRRAMNAAQQNQYASSFNDWLTGGHK
jgi:hypothetical protein